MTLIDIVKETVAPAKRLCGEIQLFDLCELERCRFKDGRFCTDPDLLERFEQIADVDDSERNRGYAEMGGDEEGENDFDEEDDDFGYEEESDGSWEG